MRNIRFKYYLLIIISVLIFQLNASYTYATTEDINSISVVLDDNYPPYSFRDNNGNLQGITIEQWKLFEKKTGMKVKLNGMEWNKAFESMKNGDFDVIDTISYNLERENFLDYSKPYATIDVLIFFQKNISGITDVSSLKGFTVAAKKGDNSINILKENGITDIVEYDNAEALIKAAKDQKLVVFTMGKPPSLYYMYKMQIQEKFNYSSPLYTSNFYRAVKEGDKELLSIINDGFSSISQSEYDLIDNKWFGNTNPSLYDLESFRIFIIAVSIIIILVLALFLWNRTLKHIVKQKTTELSNSIKEMQESEYTFRMLFEGSSDAIFILENIKVIDCNKAAIELLGYNSKADILDKSPWEFSTEKQPDGSLSSEKVLDIINYTEKYGKFKSEWWHQRSNNMILPAEIMFTSILLNGKKVIHALCRDVSERKQLEQKLEYLSYHDQLTGLYNRRFYEEELIRLDTERNIPITLVMADVNGLKLTNDAFGHKAGDILLEKVANILKRECRDNEIVARMGGDEFIILLPKTDEKNANKIIERINTAIANEKMDNAIISISMGFAIKQNVSDDMNQVFKKAEDDMYRHKLSESSSIRSKTIDLIINSLYEKNSREMLHSKRVSEICEAIAIKMNFEKNNVNQIRIAGLMHDIGKIGINDTILNKAGKLNSDEWNEVKRHSEIGYRILCSANEFSEIADYVLEHHESWNGKGYPKGLKEEEISLQARIIAVADSYDAMTSERTYGKTLSGEEAINELRRCSGVQFDPDIVKVFIEQVLGECGYDFINKP
jgi:diguanylate cyclase (GGDEF)-like protein/PAS domain S-box-containing protein/putative nucleotidyltransferase with HDIG domain